jgi:hypothetical protein
MEKGMKDQTPVKQIMKLPTGCLMRRVMFYSFRIPSEEIILKYSLFNNPTYALLSYNTLKTLKTIKTITC